MTPLELQQARHTAGWLRALGLELEACVIDGLVARLVDTPVIDRSQPHYWPQVQFRERRLVRPDWSKQ